MSKEKDKKVLKKMFSLYDECSENIEMSSNNLEQIEDENSESFINLDDDHTTWCMRKDDIRNDIKDFVDQNYNHDDLIELYRKTFLLNKDETPAEFLLKKESVH